VYVSSVQHICLSVEQDLTDRQTQHCRVHCQQHILIEAAPKNPGLQYEVLYFCAFMCGKHKRQLSPEAQSLDPVLLENFPIASFNVVFFLFLAEIYRAFHQLPVQTILSNSRLILLLNVQCRFTSDANVKDFCNFHAQCLNANT